MSISLLICLCLLGPVPGGDPIFSMADPRGDDSGSGVLHYPSGVDFEIGDLDLLEFSAERAKDGTWFVARFANKIRSPETRTSKLGGVPLKEIARHGFYNLNIDIYIDTDGYEGSGRIDTLPGRNVRVAPTTAWDKGVFLTPNPMTAANWLESHLAQGDEDDREDREGAKRLMGEYFFFPNRIVVQGKTIRFLVPDSYLGGPARADWRYLVLVTGADPEQKTDISFFKQQRSGLMMMPVNHGRPFESFQLDYDADPKLAPIVDVLLPTVELQRSLLSVYQPEDQDLTLLGCIAVVPGATVTAPPPPPAPVAMPNSGVVTLAEPRPPRPAPSSSSHDHSAHGHAHPPAVAPAPGTQSRPAVAPQASAPVMAPAPKPVMVPVEAPAVDVPTPTIAPQPAAGVADQPAETPKPGKTIAERLRELDALRRDNLVTDEEYQRLRKKILEDL